MPNAHSGRALYGFRFDDTSTSPRHEVGTHMDLSDGKQMVYVRAGSGGFTAGDIVSPNPNTWVATTIGGAEYAYAVAETAIAEDSYGWVTTRGYVSAKVASSSPGDFLLPRTVNGSLVEGAASAVTPVRARLWTSILGGLAGVHLY